MESMISFAQVSCFMSEEKYLIEASKKKGILFDNVQADMHSAFGLPTHFYRDNIEKGIMAMSV